MQGKWYQKNWIWLCAIAFLAFMGIMLFAIYLYRIKCIAFIDVRFLFMNDRGNYDWGIFWSFVEAVGGVIIGVIAFILSKKLGTMQKQQYDLEAMPFIMLGDISVKQTTVEVERDKFVKFKGLDFPYFTDNNSDPISSLMPKFFQIELMNTSKIFSRVIFKECIFENGGKTILKFNSSTNDVKTNDLFLEPYGQNSKGLFGLVYVDNSQELRGSEVKLSLILRNSYGDAYKQVLSFYFMAEEDTNVMYGLKDFAKPERITIKK